MEHHVRPAGRRIRQGEADAERTGQLFAGRVDIDQRGLGAGNPAGKVTRRGIPPHRRRPRRCARPARRRDPTSALSAVSMFAASTARAGGNASGSGSTASVGSDEAVLMRMQGEDDLIGPRHPPDGGIAVFHREREIARLVRRAHAGELAFRHPPLEHQPLGAAAHAAEQRLDRAPRRDPAAPAFPRAARRCRRRWSRRRGLQASSSRSPSVQAGVIGARGCDIVRKPTRRPDSAVLPVISILAQPGAFPMSFVLETATDADASIREHAGLRRAVTRRRLAFALACAVSWVGAGCAVGRRAGAGRHRYAGCRHPHRLRALCAVAADRLLERVRRLHPDALRARSGRPRLPAGAPRHRRGADRRAHRAGAVHPQRGSPAGLRQCQGHACRTVGDAVRRAFPPAHTLRHRPPRHRGAGSACGGRAPGRGAGPHRRRLSAPHLERGLQGRQYPRFLRAPCRRRRPDGGARCRQPHVGGAHPQDGAGDGGEPAARHLAEPCRRPALDEPAGAAVPVRHAARHALLHLRQRLVARRLRPLLGAQCGAAHRAVPPPLRLAAAARPLAARRRHPLARPDRGGADAQRRL